MFGGWLETICGKLLSFHMLTIVRLFINLNEVRAIWRSSALCCWHALILSNLAVFGSWLESIFLKVTEIILFSELEELGGFWWLWSSRNLS